MNTKIINLFGGPGIGKSTTAAGLFAKMKCLGINCELVHEVAKDMTFEERFNALRSQPYIFGKQLFRLERLVGKVDYIITDSPIILSVIYNQDYPESFCRSVIDIFNSMANINILLKRNPARPYSKVGRNQTEGESKIIDGQIRRVLAWNNISYYETRVEIEFEKTIQNIMDKLSL